jgi:hypothetical protein
MVLTERDHEVLASLDSEQFLRPMDIGGTDSSHHSATLAKLARYGLVEQKRHYRGLSGGHWRYRRRDMVQEALGYVRLLVSYGCVEDGESMCGQCGPCEASAFLKRWGLVTDKEHP